MASSSSSTTSSLTSSPAAAAADERCCSSAVNVANFVSAKLSRDRITNRNNYALWKEQMMCLVESQGLVRFIDGIAPPPPKHHADYDAWRRSDRLVKGWILGALGDEALHNVAHLDSARDVWLDLERNLGKPKRLPLVSPQEEWHKYMPLYRAAVSGDWDAAEVILHEDPDAIEARVSFTLETALHVAVGTGKSESFVSKLVDLMSNDSLAIRDANGYNALHTAALLGNLPAAKILVQRHRPLLYVLTHDGRFPLHLAAEAGHRETLCFLISHTGDDLPKNPFSGQSDIYLLHHLIGAGFLDIALDLIDKYPQLARMKHPRFAITALGKIVEFVAKDAIFLDEAQLNFWERIVCSYHADQPPRWNKRFLKLSSILWEVIIELAPRVKRIYEKKVMREQALRLVKCLCNHMEALSFEEASAIYSDAVLRAGRLGIHEVIEIIVEIYPPAVHALDPANDMTFLHHAVRNRCEKVFNLLYQSSNQRYRYSSRNDTSGNSILHMAAFLAPPHKLNLVSGAALQMQRELQWFKETDKFTSNYNKGRPNNAGKTPEMLFTEQHQNLKADGEKWMKDVAKSCMFSAALIATVVFAAAVIVPGGNPILWEKSAFTIFAVSNAASLFTSTTSLLVFLSILTSRYAEEDFLHDLPKRLCIDLVTFFLSILLMMVAFSSTLYLVFGRKNAWYQWLHSLVCRYRPSSCCSSHFSLMPFLPPMAGAFSANRAIVHFISIPPNYLFPVHLSWHIQHCRLFAFIVGISLNTKQTNV